MKSKNLKKIIAIAIVGTVVSTITPVSAYAEWLKDSQNNWNWTEDGNNATGWKQIDETWYYFDADGKMQTGWIKEDSKWYYMNTDGSMKTGWLKDTDGKWYYLAPSGEMKAGWIKDTDGKWYFADISGAMQTGVVEVQGKVYVLEASGAMVTGSTVIGGITYIIDASGAIIGDKLPTPEKVFTHEGTVIIPNVTQPTDTKETTTDSSSSSSSSKHHNSSSSSNTTVSTLADLSDGKSHTGSYKISTTGTFGASNPSSVTTINGNISIADANALTTDSITLQNLTINGTLTVDFGAGNVILDNVIVNGVNVSNVGSHSLHVRGNSSITTLNVNDTNNDAHIVVEGDASIENTTILAGAQLEVAADAINANPFANVTISPEAAPTASNQVTLTGDFNNVAIEKPSNVAVAAGSKIGTILVNQSATGAQLKIPTGTTVGTLNDSAPIEVTGAGIIKTANLGVSGTKIETAPTNISVISGVTATIGSATVDQNTSGVKIIDSVPTEGTNSESPVLDSDYLTQNDDTTTSGAVTLTWNKATDDTTPENKLKYSLYMSENKEYGNNISDWENNATLLTQANNIDSFEVTGLDQTLNYYFKLIVEDADGNKTAYTTEYRPSTTSSSTTTTSSAVTTELVSDTSSVSENADFDQTIQVKINGTGDFVHSLNESNIKLGGDFAGLTIKSVALDPSGDWKANVELAGDLKNSTGIGTITVNGAGWNGLTEGNDITCSVGVTTTSAVTINSKPTHSGLAEVASEDGSVPAFPYEVNSSVWFTDADGDNLTYSLVSAKDSNGVDVSGDVILNSNTGEIKYTPSLAQAGKIVTVVVKENDGISDSAENVTIAINVSTVPSNASKA